eukprot:jgi/Picsp_1/5280/NSC_02642-R1_protein
MAVSGCGAFRCIGYCSIRHSQSNRLNVRRNAVAFKGNVGDPNLSLSKHFMSTTRVAVRKNGIEGTAARGLQAAHFANADQHSQLERVGNKRVLTLVAASVRSGAADNANGGFVTESPTSTNSNKNSLPVRVTPRYVKKKEENVWSKMVSQVSKGIGILALSVLAAMSLSRPSEAARSGGRMGGSRSFSSGRLGNSIGGHRTAMGSRSGGFTLGGRGVATHSFFFSPFGFGMGYGYGYPMGGGGLGSLLFWGVFAIIMLQVVRGVMNQDGQIEGGYDRLSVAKVQVGLLSNARDLQRDLERIASRADTSTSRGLHFVLQETVLALMRNPDYCVYGYGKSGVEDSPEAAESRFNKLSLEERGKFEKETMVNVGGIRASSSLGRRGSRAGVGELIVVTILVASEGRIKLPKVTSRVQLRDALSTLGSLPAEDILAVEVLWTPEEEGDYFTQEDLAFDYPLLNTL